MPDPHPDSLPRADANPDSVPASRDEDARSDIEQAVDARADAVENDEGDDEPDLLTATRDYDGHAGSGGTVKNQDVDAQ